MDKWQEWDGQHIFKFKDISIADTLKLISSLAESEAFGHDRLDLVALKTVAAEIKFVKSKWKISQVTPRLKSKDLNKFEVSSYRPVDVLTTVSKLVERIAQKQLLSFLEETQQLNNSNHAYRCSMSTTSTLAEILDELYQGTEDRKMTSVMVKDQS